jgi:hypothetical protein
LPLVVLRTYDILFGQANGIGITFRHAFHMKSCRAFHALDYQDRVPRSLAIFTVVERASEPLNLHGVDARNILVHVDTLDMVVLEATPEGTSDNIFGIIWVSIIQSLVCIALHLVSKVVLKVALFLFLFVFLVIRLQLQLLLLLN